MLSQLQVCDHQCIILSQNTRGANRSPKGPYCSVCATINVFGGPGGPPKSLKHIIPLVSFGAEVAVLLGLICTIKLWYI